MPPRLSEQESGIGRTKAPFRPDQNLHDPGVGELPPCLTHQQSRAIVNDVGLFYRHEAPEQIILGLARSCNLDINHQRTLAQAVDLANAVPPGGSSSSRQSFAAIAIQRQIQGRGMTFKPTRSEEHTRLNSSH